MRFSIVIPVAPYRNAEILESIKRLDYPRNEFHVVVVKGKNPSENRNRGFEKSKGEFIVFLDDDAIIERNYLKKVEEFFEIHPEIDIVGGPQLTPKDEKGFAKISGYALGGKFGGFKVAGRYHCNRESYNADETQITSANLICKRNVLKKVKFDPKLFPGEDPKFISDAKKENFKVAYSPEIVVYHRRRATIRGMAKQFFSYGKVRPAKEKFVETLKMPFFLVPSLFVIYLFILGSYMFFNLITKNRIEKIYEYIFIIPLLAYIFLAVISSRYDSAKNKDVKAMFVLPFVYLIIHLSYGTGIIWGYLKKLR